MFLWGVIAGWTNENTICWVIVALVLFIVPHRKSKNMEKWMYFGLAGLITGYALLMLAPGNMVRLYAEQNGYQWLTWSRLKGQFSMMAFIMLYFQVFLWYFSLRSLFSLKSRNKDDIKIEAEIKLVKVFCAGAFCMTASMVFSPGFPPRSGFPGTVFLAIASGILLRVQNEYGIILIQEKAKRFLIYMSIVYFGMTVTVALNHYYEMYLYTENIVASAKKVENKGRILEVEPEKELSLETHVMSAYHVAGLGISEDVNEWKNVAFARYYGIKGICMKKRFCNKDIKN